MRLNLRWRLTLWNVAGLAVVLGGFAALVYGLLARLRALLRRGRAERETVLRAGDLEVDLLQRRATRAGEEVPLTQREFEVLAYLVRHHNAVVTRDMLGRDVWKEPDHALTNVIDVYITLLRRKLERPGRPALIHTIRGVGYTLREEP